jgi:hypothetical protein
VRPHSRLRLEPFPSYAPELTPKEGGLVWGETCPRQSLPNDVEELVEDVIRSTNGIGMSTRKLHGRILQSELPLFFAGRLPY